MDCIVQGVAKSRTRLRDSQTVGRMGQKLSKRGQQAGLRTTNQHSSARSSASYSRPVLGVSFLCLHSLWAMGKLPVLQNGLGFLYSHFSSSPLVGLFFCYVSLFGPQFLILPITSMLLFINVFDKLSFYSHETLALSPLPFKKYKLSILELLLPFCCTC